ncbi:NTP transferase domain-containing protein [Shewanella marina]|uniref:NTP transferase domain-containing protein n=1 Tax=Shewanella marina TaxID=487319 RepID=UPI00046FACF1|nr:NTP transferase domain-containing protein [Shewanella marina]
MITTLVILAAGMGSRFGGDKQLAQLGPNGETLLELSLLSAVAAGFDQAVLVIRPELEAELRQRLAVIIPSQFVIHYCYQALTDLPLALPAALAARQKPWGTAHALWSARALIDGPMAVINADDYYGDHAFEMLVQGLTKQKEEWMMVAYPLHLTLSEHGGVNRGVCQVAQGYLTHVDEYLQIKQTAQGLYGELHGQLLPLTDNTLVSMTCWGFTSAIFTAIEQALIEFIQAPSTGITSECYLPAVVQQQLDKKAQLLRVEVSQSPWFGVTYADDADWVKQQLSELQGE